MEHQIQVRGPGLAHMADSIVDGGAERTVDLESIVCGVLSQVKSIMEHVSTLYTVHLAKFGETIIGYHCAMIATLPSGPHSAHAPLTE